MRGQTTLDFALGMGVFLTTVMVVFAFIPGMLAPLEQTDPEDTTLSNRVATQVVNSAFTSPDGASRTHLACTVDFFRPTSATDHDCAYDQSATVPNQRDPGLADRLHVSGGQQFEVLIRGDFGGDEARAVLCWNGTTATVIEATSDHCEPEAGGDTRLRIGTAERPESGSTVARRVITLVGREATVEVRVW